MYALVGHYNDVYQERIGEMFEDHRYEKIVALFTKESDAKKYIEKSRLKQEIRRSFDHPKVFRDKSLLRSCEDAHIEKYFEEMYPIDPEI